jgi:hypothetical protein
MKKFLLEDIKRRTLGYSFLFKELTVLLSTLLIVGNAQCKIKFKKIICTISEKEDYSSNFSIDTKCIRIKLVLYARPFKLRILMSVRPFVALNTYNGMNMLAFPQ